MQNVSFAMLVFLMVSALFPVCHSVSKDKSIKSKELLTADDIAIYRVVLQLNAPEGSEHLNVSVRTYPLDPPSGECLQGIKLQNLSDVSHSFHELASDVLSGNNMRLVDPGKQAKIVRNNYPSKTIRKGKPVDSAVDRAFSTALFSLSEIAFDKERRHAAVSYSVWCGSLCGHGYTLIFEKVGSKWKKTDRICGGWIS
jgi:hypothetical protein